MNAAGFWQSIKTIAEDTTNKYTPFRAKATNVDSSGIQIQTYDSSEATGERFAQLRGPDIAIGDDVAVLPYGGSNLILGTVGNGPVEFGSAPRFRATPIEPISQHAFSTDSSLVPSTTAIGTYQTVYSINLPIANGTWHVHAIGGCQVRHLTNANANCYVQINTSYRTLNKIGTGWTSVQTTVRGNAVVTDGSYAVDVKVMAAHAGGMEIAAPWFILVARRTG